MFDSTTGSMGGVPGLNPWSDNNSLHQSLGGMHQFGQTNSYMPTSGMMFGTEAQMYYSQDSSQRSMQPYRRREQTMQDFELSPWIKHHVFGKPYRVGQSESMTDIGFKEQSSIFRANLGFETASTVASIGSTAAGVYAGGLVGGLATAGVGMIAGAAIESARETYMGNYKRASKVSGMANKIIGADGARGFGASENVDMAKYLGQQAADDPLLNIEDLTNITSMASSSGLLSGVSNVRGAKDKIKKLTQTLKDISDLTGSSDLQGLMSEIKKMSTMGINLGSAKQMISRLSTATDMAGLDRGLTADINNSAMMSARTGRYATEYSAGMNSTRNMEDLRFFQGRDTSGRLNDDRTAITAGISADRKITELGQRAFNMNESQLGVATKIVSEEKGISTKDALAEVSRGSSNEIRDRLNSIAKNASTKDNREMMARAIGDRDYATSVVRSDEKLSSLDLGEANIKGLYKKIATTLRDQHKTATSANIAAYAKDNGVNFSSSELAMVKEKVGVELDPIKKESYRRYREGTESSTKMRSNLVTLDRTAEKGNLYYQIQKGWGEVKNLGRNAVGGFSSAAKMNESSIQALYGLTESRNNENGVSMPSIHAGMDSEYGQYNGITEKKKLKGMMKSINPNNTWAVTTSGRKLKMDGEDGSDVDSVASKIYSYVPFSTTGSNSNLFEKDGTGNLDYDQKQVYLPKIREMQSAQTSHTITSMDKKNRQKTYAIYDKLKSNSSFSNMSDSQLKAMAARASVDGATAKEVAKLNMDDEGISEENKNGVFNTDALRRDTMSKSQTETLSKIMKKNYSGGDAEKGRKRMQQSTRDNEIAFVSHLQDFGYDSLDFREDAARRGISFDRAVSLASKVDDSDVADITKDAIDEHSSLGLTAGKTYATEKELNTYNDQSDKYKTAAEKVKKILDRVRDPKKKEALLSHMEKIDKMGGFYSAGSRKEDASAILKGTSLGAEDLISLENNLNTMKKEDVLGFNLTDSMGAIDLKKNKDYKKIKERAAEKISGYFGEDVSYSDGMEAVNIYTKERQGSMKEKHQAIQKELAAQGLNLTESDLSSILQTSSKEEAKDSKEADNKAFKDNVVLGIDEVNKNLVAVQKKLD